MRVEQRGPAGVDRSTRLVLGWRDQLLFAVEPSVQRQGAGGERIARFAGIGGRVGPGETRAGAVGR